MASQISIVTDDRINGRGPLSNTFPLTVNGLLAAANEVVATERIMRRVTDSSALAWAQYDGVRVELSWILLEPTRFDRIQEAKRILAEIKSGTAADGVYGGRMY